MGRRSKGISVGSIRREVEQAYGIPTTIGGDGAINTWVVYDLLRLSVTYPTTRIDDPESPVHHLAIVAPLT
jgi:hypothetical protein